ncbi:MAG: aminoglycoside phosphotransferase family protein [Acidimicrobiia bacterium]|nr:aminoglycoside phosphotransferase family protein [Acidimicrobiia bacterium]
MDETASANLRDHPAVHAWTRLTGAPSSPEQVVTLKREKRSSVYRLLGVGSPNCRVIAKRALRDKVYNERRIYEGILSNLPVSSIRYHGSIEENDSPFTWLFIEDVGADRYEPARADHRRLGCEWLGALHLAVDGKQSARHLEERGPSFYYAHLLSITATLAGVATRSSISADGMAVLGTIDQLCQHVQAHWGGLTDFCEPIPRTLIHGDCLPKNVHVRRTGDDAEASFFDWGGAGWGLAATDLGLLALPHDGPQSIQPDYAAYLGRAQQRSPDLDLETTRQLAQIGQLFWALKVIDKSLPEFDYPSPYVVSNFRLYARALTSSMEATSWGPPPGPT